MPTRVSEQGHAIGMLCAAVGRVVLLYVLHRDTACCALHARIPQSRRKTIPTKSSKSSKSGISVR